jgi:hypothetical protein
MLDRRPQPARTKSADWGSIQRLRDESSDNPAAEHRTGRDALGRSPRSVSPLAAAQARLTQKESPTSRRLPWSGRGSRQQQPCVRRSHAAPTGIADSVRPGLGSKSAIRCHAGIRPSTASIRGAVLLSMWRSDLLVNRVVMHRVGRPEVARVSYRLGKPVGPSLQAFKSLVLCSLTSTNAHYPGQAPSS